MPFKYRILFVDDDERLRELAKAILESHGYEVLCAKDGFDGLAALKDSLPDLIISDLQMPNMDGFEFLSVIRQRFPYLPVIVISGEFTGFDVPHSVLADAFFEKTQYTPDRLMAQIAALVRKVSAAPARGQAEGTGVDSACRKRARLGDLHQLPADLFDSGTARTPVLTAPRANTARLRFNSNRRRRGMLHRSRKEELWGNWIGSPSSPA